MKTVFAGQGRPSVGNFIWFKRVQSQATHVPSRDLSCGQPGAARTHGGKHTHTVPSCPSLSRSHYPILFPFWHYDYGHDVLVDLFPGVPVPLSPGCQLREGEEIQLFVLQPPPPPPCLEQTSADSVSSGHTRSNLICVHCSFSTLAPTHCYPHPTPGHPAAKPEAVVLTVSEENVRQMPPKPFRDSARNISGDRTGKGRGAGEGIWELREAKGESWGKQPPSSHSFFSRGGTRGQTSHLWCPEKPGP